MRKEVSEATPAKWKWPFSSLGRIVSWSGLILRESWASLQRNHSLETAATLAYYGFLALIPLLLLVVHVASRLLVSSHTALDAVEDIVERLFPAFGAPVIAELRTLAQQRGWPLVSLVVLFWSVMPLAATLRAAMRRTFSPPRTLPFWLAKIRDVAGAMTLLALFTVTVLGRLAYGAVVRRLSDGLPWAVQTAHVVASALLAILLLVGFFAVFVPMRLSWRELLGGSALASAMLFLLRPAFASFLRYNPDYGFAFGSLKAIFLIFIWIYLCFAVILLTAEILANVRRRDAALLRRFLAGGGGSKRRSRLASKFERIAAEGERIFGEGELGDVLYVVEEGAVRLERGGQLLRMLGPGDFFGEMSMLIETPRTAAAIAAAPNTRLIEVSRDNFQQILREYPDIGLALLRELARRLKDTDVLMTPPPSAPLLDPSAPR